MAASDVLYCFIGIDVLRYDTGEIESSSEVLLDVGESVAS